MIDRSILIFLLFALLNLSACKKQSVDLNAEFTLDFNKTAIIQIEGGEHEIKFIELVEESRCPPGSLCAWAGQVAVKIKIDDKEDFILGQHANYPASIQYENHNIQLLDVNYNKDKNYGKEKHYSIRLKVD